MMGSAGSMRLLKTRIMGLYEYVWQFLVIYIYILLLHSHVNNLGLFSPSASHDGTSGKRSKRSRCLRKYDSERTAKVRSTSLISVVIWLQELFTHSVSSTISAHMLYSESGVSLGIALVTLGKASDAKRAFLAFHDSTFLFLWLDVFRENSCIGCSIAKLTRRLLSVFFCCRIDRWR